MQKQTMLLGFGETGRESWSPLQGLAQSRIIGESDIGQSDIFSDTFGVKRKVDLGEIVDL